MIIKVLKTAKNIIFRFKLNKTLRNFQSIGENPIIMKGYKLKGTEYMKIGDNFYAGPNCRIEAWDEYEQQTFKPKLIIGNDVKINSSCHIGCINLIRIGDDCLLGSNVFITDHAHGNSKSSDINLHPVERPLFSKGSVIIENDCWLCESCIILPNIKIGHHSIIGAGAVVTRDVPPYSVVVGNPGRIIHNTSLDEK